MGLETLGDTASLVKEIERIHHSEPDVVDLFGLGKLVTVDGKSTEYKDPRLPVPTALSSSTLDGVVDYVRSGLLLDDLARADIDSDSEPPKLGSEIYKCLVQIVGPDEVRVLSPFVGPFRQQFLYMVAKPMRPRVIYNEFLELERFMIMIQSMFAQTAEQSALLGFLGSIKIENSVEMADDGVGQTVRQKTGITRTEEVDVKNPWVLAPDRTFVEVEQPDSAYVLRLQKNGTAALFEADGGAWRVKAIQSIKAYLQEHLPAGTIILS